MEVVRPEDRAASVARRRSCAAVVEAVFAQRSSNRLSRAQCASSKLFNAEAWAQSPEEVVACTKSPRSVTAFAHASRTAVPPEGGPSRVRFDPDGFTISIANI